MKKTNKRAQKLNHAQKKLVTALVTANYFYFLNRFIYFYFK